MRVYAVIDDINKSRKLFCGTCLKVLFNLAPKKKFSDSVIKRELNACANYGQLNVCQSVLNRYKDGDYQTMEEIVGDLQIILVSSYKEIKTKLNLKTSNYNIEDIIQQCEGKNE